MSKNKPFKNINSLNEIYSLDYEPINKKSIKSISKELCQSYKDGSLPENIFQQIIEHLLAYYIEHDLEEKISAKSYIFEEKLNKIRHHHHQ